MKASRTGALEDLPNVGPAIAADLRRIGIGRPDALRGRDPYALYDALCRRTGERHDPCVLDTFIAVVRYVDGGPARCWWAYTAERKRELARRALASAKRGASAPTVGPARRTAGAAPPSERGVRSASTGVAALANLGSASEAMLARAGIVSVAQLRRLGAVRAFRRVKDAEPRASLNLLWALHGALTGRRWREVAREDRLVLLLELDRVGGRAR